MKEEEHDENDGSPKVLVSNGPFGKNEEELTRSEFWCQIITLA